MSSNPGHDGGTMLDMTTTSNSAIKEIMAEMENLPMRQAIRKRPDTFIGSVETDEQEMYVFNEQKQLFEWKKVSYCPGLIKIFDEILVNAADHRQQYDSMDLLDIKINKQTGMVYIANNGAGLKVQKFKNYDSYEPQWVFTEPGTSANYNDEIKRVVGGRNGFGCKLTCIFSTTMNIVVRDPQRHLEYKQTYDDGCNVIHPPSIQAYNGPKGFVSVEFRPDYAFFKAKNMSDDHYDVMVTRAMQIAGTIRKPCKVRINGVQVKINSFKHFLDLFPNKHKVLDVSSGEKNRWTVAVGSSDNGRFEQISFVNNIATLQGGKHVTDVCDQVIEKMSAALSKKHKEYAHVLSTRMIKTKLCIWINCLIDNPTFDTQTKVNMTLLKKNWGSSWACTDKFMKKILDSEMMDQIVESLKSSMMLAAKKDGGKKKPKVKVEKLEDAEFAGHKTKSKDCWLILTEGDSAKALAVAGMTVVGRQHYGVYPLRGKVLNVSGTTMLQREKNEELKALKHILGLQEKKEYKDVSELRYGHVMIMTDQDHDGSHIKGLLINLFQELWPSLLKIPNFLYEFITPIVKVTLKKQSRAFYTVPEFEQWKRSVGEKECAKWTKKYYKGLGTSTSKEAIEYFSDLAFHRIPFSFGAERDIKSIEMAFGKDTKARKQWLAEYQHGTYLNHHEHPQLSMHDFVYRDLVLFAIAANQRAIPSIIDGLKVSQRKALWTLFVRAVRGDIKVASLAGAMIDKAGYHHGDAAACQMIIGMAQVFCGKDNINLFFPSGQFGTRAAGGKDAASPRYTFTRLEQWTRAVFPEADDAVLTHVDDDGGVVEPQTYFPILPLVLTNGTSGIGMGWSTNFPNYHPLELCKIIRAKLNDTNGQNVQPITELCSQLKPWYRGFTGDIVPNLEKKGEFKAYGRAKELSNTSFAIEELPVGYWTNDYKSTLEEWRDHEVSKTIFKIKSFTEHHTEHRVMFKVNCLDSTWVDLLRKDKEAFYKQFALIGTIKTSQMVAFGPTGGLCHYASMGQIIDDFYGERYRMYGVRKQHMLDQLKHQVKVAENRMQFVLQVIREELQVKNVAKDKVVQQLAALDYMSHPVKGYDYLLSMPIWSLTMERVQSLERETEQLRKQYVELEQRTVRDLWLTDLAKFEVVYEKHIAKPLDDLYETVAKKGSAKKDSKLVKRSHEMVSESNDTDTDDEASTKYSDDSNEGSEPDLKSIKLEGEGGVGLAW